MSMCNIGIGTVCNHISLVNKCNVTSLPLLNFIREVHPSLLQGRDRGLVGAGLHKAGERPLRYGEVRAALGVEGADLLAAYEASKKRKEKDGKKNSVGSDGESDDDDESESGWVEMKDEEAESDEEAPDLVLLGDDDDAGGKEGEDDADNGERGDDDEVDYSKLSKEERAKMQQEVSSTRIFTASEFAKMNKLVARQQQARRDPRLAAKLKRAIAKGEEFDDISDSDMDDSDEEDIHIKELSMLLILWQTLRERG